MKAADRAAIVAAIVAGDGEKANALASVAANGRKAKTARRTGRPFLDFAPGDRRAYLCDLIRHLPPTGATWTDGDRAQFLRAFVAALDFAVPIRNDDAPT